MRCARLRGLIGFLDRVAFVNRAEMVAPPAALPRTLSTDPPLGVQSPEQLLQVALNQHFGGVGKQLAN